MNYKAGNIVLPLLIVLTIAGFFLVKALVNRTFTEAQTEVEAGVHDRLDPFSSKYSLSRQMGSIDTWITFTNQRFNYKVTHPRYWNKLESREYPGAEDLYEAALASNVKLSVVVQENFTEVKKAEKIKTLEGEFVFFENATDSKAAYIKKNKLYYIIRLQENNYFGTETEFRGTFFNILKRFEFLD